VKCPRVSSPDHFHNGCRRVSYLVARAVRFAYAFLVYMLPPLPRCSGWAWSSLISPNRVSLPRKGRRVGLHIVLFEVCSALTRVTACTLARSPYFVTRYPKASDISSPLPAILRDATSRRPFPHRPTTRVDSRETDGAVHGKLQVMMQPCWKVEAEVLEA
jgi:hypothetical protein